MTNCTNITEKQLSFPQFCKFVIGDSLSGTLKRGPHTLACGGGCGKREGQAGRARVRHGFRGRPAPRAQAPRAAQPRLAVVTTAAVAPRAPRSSRGQAAGSSERRLLFPRTIGCAVRAFLQPGAQRGETAKRPVSRPHDHVTEEPWGEAETCPRSGATHHKVSKVVETCVRAPIVRIHTEREMKRNSPSWGKASAVAR